LCWQFVIRLIAKLRDAIKSIAHFFKIRAVLLKKITLIYNQKLALMK